MNYLSPFNNGIWVCCVLAFSVCSIVFYVTWKYGNASYEEANKPSASFSILLSAYAISQQGSPFEPDNVSSRITFFCTYLTGLILFSSYSACLTSFLAVKKDTFPFFSDASLYYNSEFDIVTRGGSSFANMYKVRTQCHSKTGNEPCFFIYSLARMSSRRSLRAECNWWTLLKLAYPKLKTSEIWRYTFRIQRQPP